MASRSSSSHVPAFGRRVIDLRGRRGLSQGEFAALLGVTPQMVEYYEHRAKNPTLEVLTKIAAALAVFVAELVGETDQKQKKTKPGPPSALEERVERVRSLPRGEQQRIIELLDDAIARAVRRAPA